MPDFSPYDARIEAWSKRTGLPLLTRHQDSDVRAFEVVMPSAARRQIWIEVNGAAKVHVWDFGTRRQSFPASVETIEARLDDALAFARNWR